VTTHRLINPAGRLDVLILRVAEECTRRILEPAISRAARRPVSLWPVVQPIAQDAVKQWGIPARPVTAADIVALTVAPKRRRKCTR
jgi:hypothetical protein